MEIFCMSFERCISVINVSHKGGGRKLFWFSGSNFM